MSQTVGIIGGGQLGRMLSEPAIKMGFNVIVIDPTPDCPAKQVGAQQIIADYKDSDAILELADKSDFLTIEIEHTDTRALDEVAKDKPVNPLPATVRMIQDKFNQKQFLVKNGFPTAAFEEITGIDQAKQLLKDYGGQMIIKSKTDAFDGRGNALITDENQIEEALAKFAGRETYGEKIVDFVKELAVMVARDMEGNIMSYPVVETVHRRNICVETYCPAGISPEIEQSAINTARNVIAKLHGAGIYGVEMFLDKNGQILINEIAPRVHNSGHYTLSMFDVSQFEQHIRAVTGQDLAEPKANAQACCMVNILGERDGPVELKGVAEAEKIPGVSVYIYGKGPTKIDRKMGHINAIAGTIEQAKANAAQARQLISI